VPCLFGSVCPGPLVFICQSINQSLFPAISKYIATVVNRQLWTGQWSQSTNHCPTKKTAKLHKYSYVYTCSADISNPNWAQLAFSTWGDWNSTAVCYYRAENTNTGIAFKCRGNHVLLLHGRPDFLSQM